MVTSKKAHVSVKTEPKKPAKGVVSLLSCTCNGISKEFKSASSFATGKGVSTSSSNLTKGTECKCTDGKEYDAVVINSKSGMPLLPAIQPHQWSSVNMPSAAASVQSIRREMNRVFDAFGDWTF